MRKNKIIRAGAWVIIALLGIGIVTDALCMLGLARGWQFIFNCASFIALPALVYVATKDEEE